MKRKLFLVLLSIVIVLAGCSKQPTKAVDSRELEKIEIKVLNVSKLPEANVYGLKLINSSPYVIKQNSVYISYPIKKGNGKSWNKCKVEAVGNKLNIKPNEEVMLNVFMQNEVYEGNKYFDIEHPEIEFVGYFNEMAEINRFQKLGGFESFDKTSLNKH